MRNFSLLMICVFLLISCRKEKAKWDTAWVAPIVNDTLNLTNLVNDSTLTVSSSGYYEVDLTRTLIDWGIENIVTIPDTSIEHTFVSVVPSLSVPPGFSFVNEVEEHELNVQDVQLKKIRVSSGTIEMKVFNPLPTKAFFTVQLPGVVKNGIEFQEQYAVLGGTTTNPGIQTATLDLSGYELDLTGDTGGEYNKLQSRLIISTDPVGPTVTLTDAQEFNVEAKFSGIKVDYARGYFGNKVVEESNELLIDFLSMVTSGSIDIPSPQLQLIITNGMKIAASATVNGLSNTNYSGTTIDLSSSTIGTPLFIDPATGSWNTLTNSIKTISFTSSNSNLESYLENLGNKHTIDYRLELNPWGNVSGGWNEIFPSSRFKVQFNAQMPLAVGADGLTLRDTFDFKLKQNTDATHISSGELVLTANNAFPFSSKINLILLDENGVSLGQVNGNNDVASSVGGTANSSGLLVSTSEVVFSLPESLLSKLSEVKFVAVKAEFNTPDASGVNVQQSIPFGAFMAVKLKARMNVNVIL